MNAKVVNALKKLNIDVEFMEYNGNKDEYIIFSCPKNTNVFYADNENEIEKNIVALTFWYKKSESFLKINQIKKLMKNAGFFYVESTDLKDGVFYGKSMIFNYYDFDLS